MAELAQALAPYAATPALVTASGGGQAGAAPRRRRGTLVLAVVAVVALGTELFFAPFAARRPSVLAEPAVAPAAVVPSADLPYDAGVPLAPRASAAPSSGIDSSAPLAAPSVARARPALPAGEGRRRATPATAGSRAPAQPPPALDPMNPALLSR
jgi:hypothetical protein